MIFCFNAFGPGHRFPALSLRRKTQIPKAPCYDALTGYGKEVRRMGERLLADAGAVKAIAIGVVAVVAIAVIGGYDLALSGDGFRLGKRA